MNSYELKNTVSSCRRYRLPMCEPSKALNASVSSFDTTSIDENRSLLKLKKDSTRREVMILCPVATYYSSIWDATNINPTELIQIILTM
jgi:hypothetical protein